MTHSLASQDANAFTGGASLAASISPKLRGASGEGPSPAPLAADDEEKKVHDPPATPPPSIVAAIKYHIMNVPYVGRYITTGGAAVWVWLEWFDQKVPTIRGHPASAEIIRNLKPGITVSLVSLPLSISLAIAAAADPVQGIITAAWAGLSASVVGGSHYNIVGPTGALSGILSEYSVVYGSEIQPLLAVLCGIICLGVWALQLERYFVFVPGAVMHGFTLGVAVIIALNQLNFALGLRGLKKHPEFLSNMWETFSHIENTNFFAVIFFLVAFGCLYTLQRRYGKIPWSIVLSVIGIAIGMLQAVLPDIPPALLLTTIQMQYGELQLQLVNISRVFIEGPSASLDDWVHLLRGALAIAMVAVLETLISAFIADRMTKTLFNQRKEVLAVGVANILSGCAGGLPATAALARTALNIKSGATSRASGIVNGVSIVILSTVLFDFFKYLPLPIVAAILVNVAARMVEWPEINALYVMDRPMFAVAIISMIACIVSDPTMGILVGTVLAMIRLLLQMRSAHAQLHVYKGTRARVAFLFEDITLRAIRTARARFLGIPTPDEEDITLEIASSEEARHRKVKALPAAGGAAPTASAVAPSLPLEDENGATPHDYTGAGSGAVAAAALDVELPLAAVYCVPGYFTYISVQAHRDRLRALFTSSSPLHLPGVSVIVFSLQECYYADPDSMEALGDLLSELRRDGKAVFFTGFHARVRRVLNATHWFHEVRSFCDYGEVLAHMREVIAAGGDIAAPPPPHVGDHHAGEGGAHGGAGHGDDGHEGGAGATATSSSSSSGGSSGDPAPFRQHNADSSDDTGGAGATAPRHRVAGSNSSSGSSGAPPSFSAQAAASPSLNGGASTARGTSLGPSGAGVGFIAASGSPSASPFAGGPTSTSGSSSGGGGQEDSSGGSGGRTAAAALSAATAAAAASILLRGAPEAAPSSTGRKGSAAGAGVLAAVDVVVVSGGDDDSASWDAVLASTANSASSSGSGSAAIAPSKAAVAAVQQPQLSGSSNGSGGSGGTNAQSSSGTAEGEGEFSPVGTSDGGAAAVPAATAVMAPAAAAGALDRSAILDDWT